MALIRKDPLTNEWVFKHGKHIGKTLQEVAESKSDQGYLLWMWEKASEDLDDEAMHALEDAIEEAGLEIP